VKPGTATAQGPGEIAGPALFITVELRNGSNAPLDTSAAFVSLVDSAGQTSVPLTTDPYRPLPASVAPGARASATYVFRVADSARDPIRFSFTYSATAPTVLFVGSAK
jgi:hypothetical protein